MEHLSNKILYKVYQYSGLSHMDIELIAKAHQWVEVAKGSHLLKEGKIPHEYLILEQGLVRSYVHDFAGKDITTNFFSPNEIVIEVASLFQRCPSKENIQAITDCQFWKLDFDAFQEFYHSIKGFNEWGRAWMANNLFQFKQRSVEMITESAMERYIKLLKEKPLVIQKAPLKFIATYLGITDTSLSRIRKEMADKW